MRQHYLPKCYLNEFVGEEGKIWSLQLKTEHASHLAKPLCYFPDQICKERDIYTINVPLQKDFVFEPLHKYLIELDIFKNYEDRYPYIIAKIKGEKTMRYDEMYLLLRILISLKLRNKYIKDYNAGGNHVKIMKSVFAELKKKYIDSTNHQFGHYSKEQREHEFQSVYEKTMSDPEFERGMYLGTILKRELSPDGIIVEIVNRMMVAKWKILVAPKGSIFITSDNPGYCLDRFGMYENTKFAEGFFIFPLTPNHCLTIDYGDPDNVFWDTSEKQFYYQLASTQFINSANRSSGLFINKYIFSNTSNALSFY